jgi:hypothetical protein
MVTSGIQAKACCWWGKSCDSTSSLASMRGREAALLYSSTQARRDSSRGQDTQKQSINTWCLVVSDGHKWCPCGRERLRCCAGSLGCRDRHKARGLCMRLVVLSEFRVGVWGADIPCLLRYNMLYWSHERLLRISASPPVQQTFKGALLSALWFCKVLPAA